MFEADIVRTRRPPITVIQGLDGLGDGFGQTVEEILTGVVAPIADVAKTYFDVQIPPQAQAVVASTPFPSISPIYLIGGGLALWWLFRGGLKGKKKSVKRARR
jgi:hypothetical protein